MATTVEELLVKIQADTAGLRRGLDKADRDTSKFAKNAKRSMGRFEKSVKSAGRALKRMAGSISPLKIALGGLAGAAGIGFIVKSSLDAIDAVGKMASKYRLATEDVAALALGAELGGTSIETLGKTALKVASFVDDFRNGLGTATDTMDALGLSMSDLEPHMNNSADLMAFLVGEINKVEDSTTRLAAANEVLGARGADTLNVFKNGLADLSAYRNETEKLGTALSEDAVDGVQSTNDSITRLGKLFTGVRDQIVSSLAPAMDFLVKKFTDWIIKTGEAEGGMSNLGKKMATSILDGAEKAVLGVAKIANVFTTFINAALKGLDAIGAIDILDPVKLKADEERLQNIKDKIASIEAEGNVGRSWMLPALRKSVTELTTELEETRDGVELVGKPFDTAGIKESFNDIRKAKDDAFSTTLTPLTPLPESQGRKVTSLDITGDEPLVLFQGTDFTDNVETNFKEAADISFKYTKQMLDQWGKDTEQMDRYSQRWLTGASEGLADFVMTGKANFGDLTRSIIKDLIRIMIQKQIAGIFGSILGVPAGGNMFAGNTLYAGAPSRAGGGRVQPGVPTLVGERGPELITTSTPSTVRNNGSLQAAARTSGQSSGNVKVEIINNGTAQQTTNASSTVTPEGIIVQVITEDIRRGGSISSTLTQSFGLNRRV